MSCKKGKFLYSFFILLTQWHEFPAPKLTNFHIFIIPFPYLNVTLFPKRSYFTAHIKKIYETGCIGRFFQKKQKDVSRTIATAKMELFVALVSSFHPLTNFTENPNIGAVGVLHTPLEHYNIFWHLCRWPN